MGSEVQLERYMPGYCSTRELDEEASSHALNYYNRQFTSVDLDLECDKDGLKQKMLEHDSVFRRQVSELHRLYRTQRDLMDDLKRTELYNHRKPMSLNSLVYQRQDTPFFPSSNTACTSPSILGADRATPNLSHLKRKTPKTDLVSAIDVDDSKDCEIIECRPGKARRHMLDLQLSADAYIDSNKLRQSIDVQATIPKTRNGQFFFGGHSWSTSKRNGMKNLNEPIQIEDDPLTLDFINEKPSVDSHYSNHFSLRTPPKNYSREASFNLRYGGECIDSRRQLLDARENNRVQSSHQLSLGQFNTKAPTLSQYPLSKSYRQSQLFHGKHDTSYGTSVSALPNQSKDKMVYSPKFAKAGLEPRILSPNHPLDVKCWPPSLTFLEKQDCNSMKKQPCFISSSAGLNKSSQASNRTSKLFGKKLNLNSSYATSIPQINELDHGSSSGSKEESICKPSVKFENLGGSKDNAGPKYSNGLKGIDLNCCGEIDLSASVANNAHHETVKMDESNQSSLLPWMKPKPVRSDSAQENFSKGYKSDLKRNFQVLDINVPCETEPVMEENVDKNDTGYKIFFDLNSCITEDETSLNSASIVARNIIGIDLEAPAPLEFYKDSVLPVTPLEAEFERRAAEAMVSFSSLKNSDIIEPASNDATETLNWFVGVVSSSPLMMTTSSEEETDYFEQMTLNLTEMNIEEHMPKNAFPTISNIVVEEPVNVITSSARLRRGQARRGRPKRDFQRDILPSITSLSRHEVAEDVQAFDGLMKSSGQSWEFGKRAAARNKPRRGRPRTVNVITPVPNPFLIPFHSAPTQPTNVCISAGIEDRNLTGWGKTTRRPRRQRLPSGSLQHVRLR